MSNQHVVKRDGEWAVRKEGAVRDTVLFKTQSEATLAAKQIASNQGGDVIVHDRQGLIRERNTYGKPDPYPPKG